MERASKTIQVDLTDVLKQEYFDKVLEKNLIANVDLNNSDFLKILYRSLEERRANRAGTLTIYYTQKQHRRHADIEVIPSQDHPVTYIVKQTLSEKSIRYMTSKESKIQLIEKLLS